MMSLPSTAHVNSSAIANTAEEMSSSDLNLNVAKGLFNWSEESFKVSHSSVQLTPIKESISEVASERQRVGVDREVKVSKPELDEFTEIQFVNDENKNTVKDENCSRRRSISDLVERYKKLMESSSSVTAKLENKDIEHESS